MITPPPKTVAWLLAAALLCVPQAVSGKDARDAVQDSAAVWVDAYGPKAAKEKPAKDKSSGKRDASTPAAASAAPRLYRFKGEKKTGAGAAQVTNLLVEDVFTGKAESLPVAPNDPAAKDNAPLAAVADAMKELEPGAVVQLGTEKQKGRLVVTSLTRAEYKPGEETPNGFVFVSSGTETKNGVDNVTVTLSKFGREVTVGVPMSRDKDNSDAKLQPDPKVDYVVRRLQSGTVVQAQVKPGKTPMLTEIYEYRRPERGKFVGLKQVEFNTWPAAGIEVAGDDGTTLTFTLQGAEQTRKGETQYVPNPQQVAAVKRLKKDTPVEVHYKLDGRAWMLTSISVLTGNEAPLPKWDEAEKMKDGKPSGPAKPAEPEMKDGDKPAEKPAEEKPQG